LPNRAMFRIIQSALGLCLIVVLAGVAPAAKRSADGLVAAARAAASTKGSDTITIIPFENLSGRAEYNWVGEGFAEALASLLDKPGLVAIQSDERDVAYKQEGLPPTAILTHAAMFKVAERAGANLVVMGTYTIEGEGRTGVLTVTSRTVNINEGRLMGRQHTEGAAILEMQRLQGDLAYEILYQHNPEVPYSREQLVTEATGVPIGAFENYIKGKLTREHDAKVGFLESAIKEYTNKTHLQYDAAAFELARIRYDDREFSAAVDELRTISDKFSRFNEVLFHTAVAEDELGRSDKALADLNRLKVAMPLFEVYNNIGVIYLRKKQYADAISHLEPASEAAPRDTDTSFNLGLAYFLSGDYQKAVSTLKLEIERRASDGEALYVLSKALEASGDHDAAAKSSDEAKKFLPAFAQWETKGAPFLGRVKEAFSKSNYYRYRRDQDSRLSPQSTDAVQTGQSDQLMESARAAFAAGRDEEALSALGKVLQTTPQSFEAHLLMGRLYERRGDTDRATNSLKAALFWQPNLPAAQVLLGRIALLKNDCESARSWDNKALQADPNDKDAQALGRLIEQKCNPARD
jgi:tetratricopeptide (TPR) repeat protein/nucleotide-binding universal stress UspA family protein